MTEDGEKQEMDLDDILLREDNKFRGSGENDVGEFEWKGKVKEKEDLLMVKLKQEFDSHTLYYWGVLNADKKAIKGHWGFEWDEGVASFEMNREE